MLTSLIALGALSTSVFMTCPVAGDEVSESTRFALDYAGMRYTLCCGNCVKPFTQSPWKYAKPKKGHTVALNLFDPVSGVRLNRKSETLAGPVDHQGFRHYFENDQNRKAFVAKPADYTKHPEKEALFCPVMRQPIVSYEAAYGYVDHQGVRYYICCSECLPMMKADPAKYAPKAAVAIKGPMVYRPQVKS